MKLFVSTINGLELRADERVLAQLKREQQSRLKLPLESVGRRGNKPRSIEQSVQRILDNVILQNGCWVWQQLSDNGYAVFDWAYKHMRLSRVMYHLTQGRPPGKAMVCHTCDNRACVNPDHFFLGNHKINYEDSVSKGRHVHGERHPASKLTEEQVREILRDIKPYCRGKNGSDFARKFGVTPRTINQVVCRETWTHVAP